VEDIYTTGRKTESVTAKEAKRDENHDIAKQIELPYPYESYIIVVRTP
jgi:hypothetical protein